MILHYSQMLFNLKYWLTLGSNRYILDIKSI